jgi:hypothetical protein
MEKLVFFFHQLVRNISDDPITKKLVIRTIRILHIVFLESQITINSNSPKCLHSFFLAGLTRFWCYSKESNQYKDIHDSISDLLCFIISDPDNYLQHIYQMAVDWIESDTFIHRALDRRSVMITIFPDAVALFTSNTKIK